MIKWPHTYYINRWYGAGGEDTALMYRTDNLNDFMKHVEDEITKNKLTSRNSRFIIRGDKTFFSYFVDYGEYAWKNVRYLTSPDKTFTTIESYKKHVKWRDECQSSQGSQTFMTA